MTLQFRTQGISDVNGFVLVERPRLVFTILPLLLLATTVLLLLATTLDKTFGRVFHVLAQFPFTMYELCHEMPSKLRA